MKTAKGFITKFLTGILVFAILAVTAFLITFFAVRFKGFKVDSVEPTKQTNELCIYECEEGKSSMGTFLADIVLQVLSFVAQNERENIRKRQAEGIAAAKARGVQFGRPEKPIPDNFNELVRQWEKKQIDIDTVASMCDMAVPTFYKKLREQKLLGKLR